MRARLEVFAVLVCAATALACKSPPPKPPAQPEAAAGAELFVAARAWEDLEHFAAIGPRVMGTEGAAKARRYIISQLGEVALQTERQGVRVEREGEPPLRLENVAAVIPGESSDVLLLLAPYDTRPYATFEHRGVNAGGSGAAVLLEMARALSRQQLPYTVWFVFLEGEAPLGEGVLAEPSHFGSRGLAQRLVELEAVAHIRLGVVFDSVCDADLVIARDLGSHRIYREEFWYAAKRLGRTDAFPRQSGYESPRSSQEALREVGVPRVVTLTDTSFGGDEPPGLFAGNEDDTIEHCSPASLATVGLVTLETLQTITRRLARIDRFSRSPFEGAEALRIDQLHDEEAAQEPEVPPPGEAASDAGELPAGAEAEEPSGAPTGARTQGASDTQAGTPANDPSGSPKGAVPAEAAAQDVVGESVTVEEAGGGDAAGATSEQP